MSENFFPEATIDSLCQIIRDHSSEISELEVQVSRLQKELVRVTTMNVMQPLPLTQAILKKIPNQDDERQSLKDLFELIGALIHRRKPVVSRWEEGYVDGLERANFLIRRRMERQGKKEQ